jgi:hypothetical protein
MNKYWKVISSGLLVVLLAGAFLFAFPSSTAHAEGLDDGPIGKGEKLGIIKQRLEAIFEREKDALVRQARNIEKLTDLSLKAQERIDALKAKGKDVSGLEAALANFESKLPEISASHKVAVDLIDSHIGFGENGKVTDIDAARNTVKNVHESLEATRQLMIAAVKDVRQAIRTYHEANSPGPTQQP